MNVRKQKNDSPRYRVKNFLFAAFLPMCLACAHSKPTPELTIQRSHEMKVSVYTEGREVKNFNNALVHRIEFSNAAAKRYLAEGESALPFQATKERDNRGQAMGLRISKVRTENGKASFGLQDNDLVTAIGAHRAENPKDFALLFQNVLTKNEASLTFERTGLPHKNLYYLGTAQSH